MDPRRIQSACRDILNYEDVLKYLIEQEEKLIKDKELNVKTQFELTKAYYEDKGFVKGLKRLLQRINTESR